MKKEFCVGIIESDIHQLNYIKNYVNDFDNYKVVGEFEDTFQFLKSTEKIDVLILDLILPKLNGLESLKLIFEKSPYIKVIINSLKEDIDIVVACLKEGAFAFIDKNNFNIYIEQALNSVTNDNPFLAPKITKKIFDFFSNHNTLSKKLTSRERDIVNGIVVGLSYKMIADNNNISLDTVRMNIKNIYKKYDINSKSELIKMFNGISIFLPKF